MYTLCTPLLFACCVECPLWFNTNN